MQQGRSNNKEEENPTEADRLAKIKKKVQMSREYFAPNLTLYDRFRRFVFDTTLTDDNLSVLKASNRPQVEFNIMEAYISRLRGEFAKQEPSLSVTAEDEFSIDLEMIKVIEGHVRHILFESNKNGCEYDTYSDTLSGGFCVWKVWTEYAHPLSFDHVIKFGRVFDPTLTGFDPLARHPSKCDGDYAYELFPKRREELRELYPKINWDTIKVAGEVGGFTWSYKTGDQDIFLLCEMYEKKLENVKIVLLTDGRKMTEKKYKKELDKWQMEGKFEQYPQIRDSRYTDLPTIKRIVFISDHILEEEETDLEYLPYVFVDGNSIYLRDQNQGPTRQKTRPYGYHLEGAQKLKNVAGQALGYEIQNMVQHKWIVAKESIPPQYVDAYKDNQTPSVIVYNATNDKNPNQPLPPPQVVQRTGIPPEVMNTFSAMDSLSQMILGSYDSALGVNDNQLSGKAIIEGATQSNAAAMPYIVGFLQALNQVATIIVSLIPKYYTTPRTIPVLDADSKRSSVRINDDKNPQSMKIEYDSNSLNVKVEPGLNFSIQKSRSLQQITSLAQAMPIFGQFMNEKGLGVIVHNLEIKNADQLSIMADQYMQQMDQAKQQAQSQPNPEMIKLQNESKELDLRAQKQQTDAQHSEAKIGIAQQTGDTNRLKVMLDAGQAHNQNLIELAKQNTEKERAAVDLSLSIAGHHHKVGKDITDIHHKVHVAQQKDEQMKSTP